MSKKSSTFAADFELKRATKQKKYLFVAEYNAIMSAIIGREKEVDELKQLVQSQRAEFVAIYGRRRVGKTFLVDEALREDITFRHAGLSPVDENGKANKTKDQLLHFYHSLLLQGWKGRSRPKNWLEAFFFLEQHLRAIDTGERQVVFIDELPWMDTPRSGFVTALEAFWNGWACHRPNMMLVVCGSANSWMLDNLVNNHGGLYGRTTYEIKLIPFTLSECEQFYQSRGIQLSRYDIAQANMILGGIPYYMGYFTRGKSLAQNIDNLFFAPNAKLKDEFSKLFSSVFTNPDEMMRIVRYLATRRKGYTREDIAKGTHLSYNGDLSKWLKALAASDFVVSYVPFGESARNVHFRLIDPFCLFYLKFVDGQTEMDEAFWMNNVEAQKIKSWRGFAFEDLCLRHVDAIKRALQIGGISSSQSAWAVSGDDQQEGTQIDLLIARKDNVVNMCEMKFYSEEFAVKADYHKKLVHRTNLLQPYLSRKMVIHSTLVTTYGLTYNEYSGDFTNVVTLEDLFE